MRSAPNYADEGLVAPPLQGLADEQLVPAHAVEVARIQQVDSALERRVDGGDVLRFVTVAVPAPRAHAHAAERDREHVGTVRT